MRLSLRKELKPYSGLDELARELNLTRPALNRLLRDLKKQDKLSLHALTSLHPPDKELRGEGVFELFHQFERCLVCGHTMKSSKDREIGWGEFTQCDRCDYSAHELANYKTRKDAAENQLHKLVDAARKTHSILRDRAHHTAQLREK